METSRHRWTLDLLVFKDMMASPQKNPVYCRRILWGVGAYLSTVKYNRTSVFWFELSVHLDGLLKQAETLSGAKNPCQ